MRSLITLVLVEKYHDRVLLFYSNRALQGLRPAE
jgi:hypothetical protein